MYAEVNTRSQKWIRLTVATSSVENLLKLNPDPADLRPVMVSFNAPGTTIEREAASKSLYGESGLITLDESEDPHTNDLMVVLAIYLLCCAVLITRWEQDRKLRQEIERGPQL